MIDPAKYGVSFSVKQCHNFGIDPHVTLDWLLAQGIRRFRLMSYWNEHEKQPSQYDFTELDWQVRAIAAAGGEITMSLGAKQPRWPEYHWPNWAWEATKQERSSALVKYVEQVVTHYDRWQAITSWQLENEALLTGFGERIEIDRARLQAEYAAIKRLDKFRPVYMSTSNGWGIPLRRPLPDKIGFSYYLVVYGHGRYHSTIQKPWLHRVRKQLIEILLGKRVFIHELQCEPWGHTAIWKMTTAEQDKSMSTGQIAKNFAAARKIRAFPIDIWGAEWWYWRHMQGDDSIWNAVKTSLH